jgi:(S)-sulfolactate dehydrogenase
MPEVVVSGFMDEAAGEYLRAALSVLYDPKLVDRPGTLTAALANSRGLIVRNRRSQVRGELLAPAKQLEVAGRTMGLVGFGAIAPQVPHRCGALGMSVAA